MITGLKRAEIVAANFRQKTETFGAIKSGAKYEICALLSRQTSNFLAKLSLKSSQLPFTNTNFEILSDFEQEPNSADIWRGFFPPFLNMTDPTLKKGLSELLQHLLGNDENV